MFWSQNQKKKGEWTLPSFFIKVPFLLLAVRIIEVCLLHLREGGEITSKCGAGGKGRIPLFPHAGYFMT